MGTLPFLVFLRSQFGVSRITKGFHMCLRFCVLFKGQDENQEGEERHLVTEANETQRRTQSGKMGQT